MQTFLGESLAKQLGGESYAFRDRFKRVDFAELFPKVTFKAFRIFFFP